MTNNNW